MGSNSNLFEDFSGISSSSSDPNPYNALIEACNNDPMQIQSVYARHREARASKQRAYLLSDAFEGVNPDSILRSLLIERALPENRKTGYLDPRNCLTLWVRPPNRIRLLVDQIQCELKKILPNMWFMPLNNLHLTALEVTNSLTPEELESFVSEFGPLVGEATELLGNAAKEGKLSNLEKPMVTFDASAVALSFLPSAIDPEVTEHNKRSNPRDFTYTYHHLRRDLWDICSSTSRQNCQPISNVVEAASSQAGKLGVPIKSRYVVPSIHLTVGRFVSRNDTSKVSSLSLQEEQADSLQVDGEKVKQFMDKIDEINAWLKRDYHESSSGNGAAGVNGTSPGSWVVGEEIGLDCTRGRLWYGDGERIRAGERVNAYLDRPYPFLQESYHERDS